MNRFTKHIGKVVALDRAHIDTDQIIPKQFLKRIERSGYGEFLFYDWRFDADGTPKAFVLNEPRYKDASILITGANFGCGSSREHAPWSLLDYGFKVIIAPSFADIFYNNSLKNGLLPIVLSEQQVAQMVERSRSIEDYKLTVDLENKTLSDMEGFQASFDIDEFRLYCLLRGLDDIALTLQHETKISAYENKTSASGRSPSFTS